jgi:hypothetical protein
MKIETGEADIKTEDKALGSTNRLMSFGNLHEINPNFAVPPQQQQNNSKQPTDPTKAPKQRHKISLNSDYGDRNDIFATVQSLTQSNKTEKVQQGRDIYSSIHSGQDSSGKNEKESSGLRPRVLVDAGCSKRTSQDPPDLWDRSEQVTLGRFDPHKFDATI